MLKDRLIFAGLVIFIFACGVAFGIAILNNSLVLGPDQTVSDVVARYNICKAEAQKGQDCFMLPLTVPVEDMRGIVPK